MVADLELYLNKIDISSKIERLKKKLKNKKIIIYGAGELFERINIKYGFSGFNIIAISDGKFEKKDNESYFLGYKKIAPDEIMDLKPDCILVCVLGYQSVIDFLLRNKFIDNKTKIYPLLKEKYDNKFFGCYGDYYSRSFYVFGIEIGAKFDLCSKYDLKINKAAILDAQRRLITASRINNKAFSEFRNKYQGKSIVLIGAGPTLNDFEPIKDAIYVGCNRAFLYNKVKFDFLFSIDKIGIKNYYEEFINYQKDSCIKFVGDNVINELYQIPRDILYRANARNYKSTIQIMPDYYSADIDCEPLGHFATVSLQAMQFILFCNPKKVYLVGIDCSVSKNGHFMGKTPQSEYRSGTTLTDADSIQRKNWYLLKKFVKMYYPKTEIISVNPVGLKGFYKDVYTKKYIEANPELFKDTGNVEILE